MGKISSLVVTGQNLSDVLCFCSHLKKRAIEALFMPTKVLDDNFKANEICRELQNWDSSVINNLCSGSRRKW